MFIIKGLSMPISMARQRNIDPNIGPLADLGYYHAFTAQICGTLSHIYQTVTAYFRRKAFG